MKPRLAFDCPEKWGNMKIGLVSRFCENCEKDVYDFTTMTKEEIVYFMLTNRSNKVCGRILKSQLNYHHEELLVTIQSYLQKNKNSNLAFYLLTAGTLMLLSCSNQREKSKEFNNTTTYADDSSKQRTALIQNRIQNDKEKCTIDSLHQEDLSVVGEITIDGGTTDQSNGVRIIAEVMPEFVGGVDNLFLFLNENLKYPDWGRKNKIEGTVYVSFTINRNGNVIDPKIIRSVQEARNFNGEVLRIIKSMPDWIPGQEHGENVDVRFTLPIKFRL